MDHIFDQNLSKLITRKVKPSEISELDTILHPIVKEWFFKTFPSYSLPQLYAVCEIHARKNILVSAPTGATKTLTGFLAILNELVDAADKGILENRVYAVYISPLKALNADIQVNLLRPLEEIKLIAKEKYFRDLDIRVGVRGGDTTASEKAKMLKNAPHILITTPESLAIVLASTKFSAYLKKVQWCVVDEVHALAENKRGTHLMLSVESLERLSGYLCRVGLSATIAPLEEIAHFLVGAKRECLIVDVQFLKQLDLQVLSPVNNLIDITYSELHTKTYILINQLIQEHKTTLIFTNTRAGTERVVHHLKEMFPKNYDHNIGAHHGSLSKEHRLSLESRLRNGELRVVVCSTSLELGIDIGYIDLVLCLGSPKTVARTLQRIGRSGHRLHATTKGRIIVMDRDDLVECSVLLKNAIEKKIDRINIPQCALDVLTQFIIGSVLGEPWKENELYNFIIQSYSYRNLKYTDFDAILKFLAGDYGELEDRRVYAKIWRKDGMIGKRGKMLRILYMTNIGTIPNQSGVLVKLGNHVIGSIDENFLERLKRRDVFVLGGSTYEFRYSRGMTVTVEASIGKPPTVPRWASETLPLSFDLAMEINRFRGLMNEKFEANKSKAEIIEFIFSYLHIDSNAAEAIYLYIKEQFEYAVVPDNHTIVIEHFKDERGKKVIFHTLYGRRVNDCLSRAVGYVISKFENTDVEIGISDNGFYIGTQKNVSPESIFKVLTTSELLPILNLSIDKSEVLTRRFRHCAERSFMILRNYKGRTRHVSKQQSLSTLLLSAVKRVSLDFPILQEARREVLEDLMDSKNTELVLSQIKNKEITFKEIHTLVPSPFAFHLIIQGYTDVLKIDDKMEFLKRMHTMVLAKISLDKGKNMPSSLKGKKQTVISQDTENQNSNGSNNTPSDFEYNLPKIPKTNILDDYNSYLKKSKKFATKEVKKLLENIDELDTRIPLAIKFGLAYMVTGKEYDISIMDDINKQWSLVLRHWPKPLVSYLEKKRADSFSYDDEWQSEEIELDDGRENLEISSESIIHDEKSLLLSQMQAIHNQVSLEPLIYFELEKFIEDPKGIFDRKFKVWLNQLLQPPIPRIWKKELLNYLQENVHHIK